ncbi:MAG: hypothetical protein CM15mP2_0170 [Methanobacteriota archaeon]|nr:MAG: hypothetical protein CM15mP2_0170 [Euryarchaeota archaeon]
MSAQRRLLAQPIVHLVITALLILLSALTISDEDTEFISFIIWILLLSDPLIVHHILSPNKKETKQEGKPERIFPELDIPLPVTEENKATYLAELEQISAAEQWVEKHAIEEKTNGRGDRKIRDDIAVTDTNNIQSRPTIRWFIAIPLFTIIWVILLDTPYADTLAILIFIGMVMYAILRIGKTSYVGSDAYLNTFYYIVIALISGVVILLSVLIIFIEILSNPSSFIYP